MKKVIIVFICICIFSFLIIWYVTNNNQKYFDKMEKNIIKNTDVKKIDYFNVYNNYYIISDDDYLYVFDSKYIELLRIDKILIHENSNNYDIIYKDGKVMYLHDYYKDKNVIYDFYDLYTYELINSFKLGG